MSLEIYLIRHGESEVNKMWEALNPEDRIILGRNICSELTDEGIKQAKSLAERLNGIEFDRLVSSAAVRAQQTARHYLQEKGVKWIDFDVSTELVELHQGDHAGRLVSEARTLEIREQINAQHWYFRAPKGESQDDVFKRASAFIESEILGKDYESVAIFTHGNLISSLKTGLLNLEKEKSYARRPSCTEINVLKHDRGVWSREDNEAYEKIRNGKTGIVIQAGGDGERLKNSNPKPIVDWGNGETCLLNIIKGVPEQMPIFLHIQPKQDAKYRDYIAKHIEHPNIHFIYQDQSNLYSEGGHFIIVDGNPVKVNNGPGSFGKGLGKIVKDNNIDLEYFCVYDGCKEGFCLEAFAEGLQRMMVEDSKAFAYTTELNNAEDEERLAARRDAREEYHPRYDRIVDGEVHNKNDITPEAAGNPKNHALSGLNIFQYDSFLEKIQSMAGREEKKVDYSVNGVVLPGDSYYKDYRITNILDCYDKDELTFALQRDEHYFKSIKMPKDLERVRRARI